MVVQVFHIKIRCDQDLQCASWEHAGEWPCDCNVHIRLDSTRCWALRPQSTKAFKHMINFQQVNSPIGALKVKYMLRFLVSSRPECQHLIKLSPYYGQTMFSLYMDEQRSKREGQRCFTLQFCIPFAGDKTQCRLCARLSLGAPSCNCPSGLSWLCLFLHWHWSWLAINRRVRWTPQQATFPWISLWEEVAVH